MFEPIEFGEERVSDKKTKGKVRELVNSLAFCVNKSNFNVYNVVEARFYRTIFGNVCCELIIRNNGKAIARGVGFSGVTCIRDKKDVALNEALSDCGLKSHIFVCSDTVYNISSVMRILCKHYRQKQESFVTVRSFEFGN